MIGKAISRLESLLAANREAAQKDAAGVYVPGAMDNKIRRQAIIDCLKIVKECRAPDIATSPFLESDLNPKGEYR